MQSRRAFGDGASGPRLKKHKHKLGDWHPKVMFGARSVWVRCGPGAGGSHWRARRVVGHDDNVRSINLVSVSTGCYEGEKMPLSNSSESHPPRLFTADRAALTLEYSSEGGIRE